MIVAAAIYGGLIALWCVACVVMQRAERFRDDAREDLVLATAELIVEKEYGRALDDQLDTLWGQFRAQKRGEGWTDEQIDKEIERIHSVAEWKARYLR